MYKNYQFGDLNSAYIMGLYEDYLNDPDSVGLDLVDFFESEELKDFIVFRKSLMPFSFKASSIFSKNFSINSELIPKLNNSFFIIFSILYFI